MSLLVLSVGESDWVAQACDALAFDGCVVITDAVTADVLDRTRTALYSARAGIDEEIGTEKLKRAGEFGTLRIPMKYDPTFFDLLACPEILRIVDATIGETAILHVQNGFILPTEDGASASRNFQTSFHRDFPRYLNGYLASVNAMLAVDAFTSDNGATRFVPGTHQRPEMPANDYLERRAVAATAPAGSILLFDSTICHAAGRNVSGKERLAVNHQFTRPFFKQQIDYVRALGDDVILARPERTRQILGWYTRVVTSLDEYYRPADERLYRGGQG